MSIAINMNGLTAREALRLRNERVKAAEVTTQTRQRLLISYDNARILVTFLRYFGVADFVAGRFISLFKVSRVGSFVCSMDDAFNRGIGPALTYKQARAFPSTIQDAIVVYGVSQINLSVTEFRLLEPLMLDVGISRSVVDCFRRCFRKGNWKYGNKVLVYEKTLHTERDGTPIPTMGLLMTPEQYVLVHDACPTYEICIATDDHDILFTEAAMVSSAGNIDRVIADRLDHSSMQQPSLVMFDYAETTLEHFFTTLDMRVYKAQLDAMTQRVERQQVELDALRTRDAQEAEKHKARQQRKRQKNRHNKRKHAIAVKPLKKGKHARTI